MAELEEIARACHEANRVLQDLFYETPSAPWDDVSQDMRDSAAAGVVEAQRANTTPESLHQAWLNHKLDQGWERGHEKSETLKTHPLLVPWDQLPPEQRYKDQMFLAIVRALS